MSSSTITAEQSTILKSLTAIRQRLYAVRLAERAALALVIGGIVGVLLVVGRVIFDRYPVSGEMLTAMPLAAAVWLLIKAKSLAQPSGSLARRGGISPGVVRIAAILIIACVAGAFFVLLVAGLHGAPLWSLPVGAAGLFLIGAVATVKPVEPKVAAIFVDQQAGLEERVSTALEFFQRQPATALESAFRAPVIASALDACQTIRTAKVGYSRIDRRVYALAATVAIAAAGVSLLTPMVAKAGPALRHYDSVVQKGETLAEKLKEIEATKPVEDPATKEKLAQLQKIAELMKQGNLSPFDANNQLDSMEKQFKQEQKDADRQADLESAMEKSDELKELKKASDEVKSAAEKTAGSNSPGAQLQHENAEKGMKKAAGDLAGKLAGMSDKEKQNLANELKQDAEKANDPQVKKDLEDASKAAASGDSQKMEQALADAGSKMGQNGAQQQMSSEAARAAMNQIERAEGGGSSSSEQEANKDGQSGNQGQNQGQHQGGDGSQQANGGEGGSGDQQQEGSQGGNQGGNQSGNQSGQGSGSQTTGQSAESQGNGSTNFSAPGGPGDKNADAPVGGIGTFVKVYDAKPIDTRGKLTSTPGHINPLGTPSGSVDTLAQGDKDPATIKTYESELPAARKKALDDLSTQPIPPQDKDLIRAYYDK